MEVEHDQRISISRAEFKDCKNKSTYRMFVQIQFFIPDLLKMFMELG